MPSETEEGKRHRHQVGDINMPTCEAAFAEILKGVRADKAPSRRLRVLAQVFIDIWMIRIMDCAAVLKCIEAIALSPHKRVVVVCYFGSAHTKGIEEFWCKQGLTSEGLSSKGFVGKPNFDEEKC